MNYRIPCRNAASTIQMINNAERFGVKMETLNPLSEFFSAIKNDGRISITHIGIYVALLQYWKEQGFVNPITAFSHNIMQIAKISSSATYHKCIKDLHDFGYLKYEPSFSRKKGSLIYLD